jgi:hypothetical protein
MKTPISILHPRMTWFVLQRSNSHATRDGREISGKASTRGRAYAASCPDRGSLLDGRAIAAGEIVPASPTVN